MWEIYEATSSKLTLIGLQKEYSHLFADVLKWTLVKDYQRKSLSNGKLGLIHNWWIMKILLSIIGLVSSVVTFRMSAPIRKDPIPTQMLRKIIVDGKIQKEPKDPRLPWLTSRITHRLISHLLPNLHLQTQLDLMLEPSQPSAKEAYPLINIERDLAIILATSMSWHKHSHESNHSESEKETSYMPEISTMEASQGIVIVVSSTSTHDNPSEWIDIWKRKERRKNL